MSYAKAIKIFEDLPEEKKALIRHRYERDGLHCAMGILIEVPKGANSVAIFDLLNPNDSQRFSKSVSDQVEGLQMTRDEAKALQDFVDTVSSAPYGRLLFNEALQFMKDRCADH